MLLFFSLLRTLLAKPYEWITVPGNPEVTRCADGSDWKFFYHPGEVQKLQFFLQGGGGCWSAFTCEVMGSLQFTQSIDKNLIHELDDPTQAKGIFNHSDPRNPVSSWHKVFIPYCTGDVHTGSSKHKYNAFASEYHWGWKNIMFALNWVLDNLSFYPEDVLASGCSAGGVGSYLFSIKLKDTFPKANLFQFADSFLPVFAKAAWNEGFRNWPMNAAIPERLDPENYYPWSVDVVERMLEDLMVFYPNATFNSFAFTEDKIEKLFYWEAQGGYGTWEEFADETLDWMHGNVSNYAYYISPGNQHCCVRDRLFYDVEVDGYYLYEWLRDILLDGDYPKTIHCDTCIGSHRLPKHQLQPRGKNN